MSTKPPGLEYNSRANQTPKRGAKGSCKAMLWLVGLLAAVELAMAVKSDGRGAVPASWTGLTNNLRVKRLCLRTR
jgi:hypothetical protein